MRNDSNVIKVLNLLADGSLHSGEALAKQLGVTRAAINKYIQQIKTLGIELSSVTNKGYQLNQKIDLLSEHKLIKHYNLLSQDKLDLDLIPIIDSTNQYLLEQIPQLESGYACVSEYQKTGRGRRGRAWYSPFGCNLYLSVYWRFEQGPAATMGLSLVIGIVTAKLLRELTGKNINVKWPNDLYLDEKKVAGILVEIAGKSGDVAHVVIGIGINLNMHNPDQNVVNQAWSNLGAVDRNLLVTNLLHSLRKNISLFEEAGFAAFYGNWNKYDNFMNQPIKLIIGDKEIEGIAKGINHQGAILIERNNQIESYVGGEISLRSNVINQLK